MSRTCTLLGKKSLGLTAAILGFAATTGAFAQSDCGATISVQQIPPGQILAVGQSLQIQVTFGVPVTANLASTISTLSVRLDCANNSSCSGANFCTDEGPIISYNGDASIITNCPAAVSSNNPGGGAVPNQIDFTFNPPLVFQPGQTCLLTYGITIDSLGADATPKLLRQVAFFEGICTGGLTASACGSVEFNVVVPAINIEKTACPELVCEGGSTPVTYTYLVTNLTNGSPPPPLSNVVVTDDTCANVQFQGGDTNGNMMLDSTEVWTYTCTTNVAGAVTNTATVNAEYVNAVGSTPVSDMDTATVNAVRIVATPAVCGTTFCASVVGPGGGPACPGATCSWTGPGFTSNECCITLDDEAEGQYCVTVTCPGTSSCPGSPPPPISATCCVEFDAQGVDCSITTPPSDCPEINNNPTYTSGSTVQFCANVTGGTAPFTYAWSLGTDCGTGWSISGSSTGECVNVVIGAPDSCCTLRLTVTDDEGCTSKCIQTICACPDGGGEGCTPGFWKQPHHLGHWQVFSPNQQFCSVFNCAGACSAAAGAYNGKTLLQVLSQGGGGFKALGRHAVAALLNSAHSGVDYAFTTAEVIAMVNAAIASCSPNDAHQQLAAENEQGCPLSGHADLNNDGLVNQTDLNALLANWGRPGVGDINNDGIVNHADLAILMQWWGS